MPHATMYIWRDRKSNGWRGGHLALALPPTGAGGILQNSFNNYISWWPADVDTPEDAERVGGNRRGALHNHCLLYTSPSPRDSCASRMPSSA